MNVTVTETVPVTGICPADNKHKEISVTCRRYQPLGETKAYAIVTGINCPFADNGCTIEQCPIAYSRVYW